MANSPSIIYNISFTTHDGTDTERQDFYRCKFDRNIIEYLDRKGAVDKLSEEEQQRVKAFVEMSNKSEKNIVDYADERKGSTGIFTQKKDFAEKDKFKLKKELGETKSNIWNSVISFTPEFGAQFCNNKDAAREIIENCLPQLFKNSKLDYDNIEWFGAFHTNTDNPHIHLVFFEKKAQNLDSKGNKSFIKAGKIPEKNLDNFKTGIAKYLNMSKLDYLPMRDKIRNEALLNFKNNKEMLNCFLRYGSGIIEDGNFQFKRLSKENQELVKSFVKKTIESSPELETMYAAYKEKLLNTQSELIGLYSDTRFSSTNKAKKIPDEVNNFYGSRTDELDNRLCNSFLKILKDYALQRNKIDNDYNLANNSKRYLSKIRTDSVYGRASDDYSTKTKAYAARDLFNIANKLIKGFMLDSGEIVTECDKTTEQYKRECIERGETLIYDDQNQND